MGLLSRVREVFTGKTEAKLARALEVTNRALAEADYRQSEFRERIAELEFGFEDAGWRQMAQAGDREFSRRGLTSICHFSRLMFLKNPLVNRAVTLQSQYVWAQGVTITSEDDAVKAAIDLFVKENQDELTGHQARTLKEQALQVDGNIFFALFSDISTGSVKLRTIPVDEVDEIITNPDDSKEVWFYKRIWNQPLLNIQAGVSTPTPKMAYYPDLRYQPVDGGRVDMIGGQPVLWDTPVYHVKVGGLPDMKFGLPETYQSLEFAQKYTKFLENWSTIVDAHARFAFKADVKGGSKVVQALNASLNTTVSDLDGRERNPPPVTGSTFVSSGIDLTPVRTAGATTSAQDGRPLRQMVASSYGMPETFFGDLSVGNHATAKTLDRPTELKFLDRQELWRYVIRTLIEYVIAKGNSAANSELRVAGGREPQITITFPPILEHDVAESINAIVAAATLNGSAFAHTMPFLTLARLLLEALGVPNIQDILDQVEEPEPVQPATGVPPVKPAVVEALRELKTAIEKHGEAKAA